MGAITVPISKLKTTIYEYKIRFNQKIPIFVITLPIESAQMGADDYIEIPLNSNRLSLSDIAPDYPMPIWTQLTPNIYKQFLEVYQDDNMFISYEADSTFYSLVIRFAFNGAYYLTNKTPYQFNTSGTYLNLGVYIYIFQFADGKYITPDSGGSGATNYFTFMGNWTKKNANSDVDPGKSKGIVQDGTFYLYQSYSGKWDIYNNHDAISEDIILRLLNKSKIYNPNDPYPNTGDEPDDPPDGDFDYTSDDVVIPDLPQTSVTDSGLVTLFAPDNSQLQALARYLWSDAFSLDSFKKLFNNPMDCILGLSILPIHLPHGAAKEITVGNLISTVSCDVCARQFVKLNCGTFTMSRSAFTGGYLDYSPYTKAYLYLPFIGSQQIDIDEFMNTTIGVEYHIDILTGAMFCYVTRNSKLLLTYSGNCAENVPLSANDFTSTISSMLSIATVGAGAVATIATAGAAAPALAGASEAALGARTASSLIGAGATGAGAVMNSKPSVQHSGSLGGGAGAMGCLYPYILFVAPRISLPEEQNKYTGFPSNKIVKIGELSGFNVVEAVNLSVKGATDAEVSEIEAVLRNGVII